jgi:hypothetical protein
MKMQLPVDFKEKLQLPPAVGGLGYPYRISAGDLMLNFKYLEDLWPKNPGTGDLMYYNRLNGWSLLSAPTDLSTSLHVLTHDGAHLSWTPTEEC